MKSIFRMCELSGEGETRIVIPKSTHDKLMKMSKKRHLEPNLFADSLYQAYLQEP